MNKRKNILIVDDSNTNILLLNTILSEKGYLVKTANSVADAKKRINVIAPELILLDINMPQINGLAFLKELKGENKTKDIPVIIVSAHTNYSNKEEAKKYGAIDFVEKPIDIDSIIVKVTKILEY